MCRDVWGMVRVGQFDGGFGVMGTGRLMGMDVWDRVRVGQFDDGFGVMGRLGEYEGCVENGKGWSV